MSLCRVDSDRLRGLASQLGTTAVALDDAAPAASWLTSHGHVLDGAGVAAALTGTVGFLTEWQTSLEERAALLERQARLFASPTVVTASLLREVETRVRLATHAGGPERLASDVASLQDLAEAQAVLEHLAATAAAPSAVAAYIGGIDEALATQLAAATPATMGALGGVPHRLRFASNRLQITAARTQGTQALDANAGNPRTLRAQLAVLDGLDDGRRNFLVFDWERERIVEWIGPPDAKHVAFFVPGAGVGAAEYPALAAKLDRLVRLDRGADLAIIAALVYDTPPTVAHAAFGQYADRGGPEIVGLLEGLELNDRHVTLVGHSYGAVVLGEALQLGLAAALPADVDVVALGAPGVRADHVSALGISAERFWAARLPDDEIAGALHPAALPKLAACSITGLVRVLRSCATDARLLHGLDPVAPAFGGSVLEPAAASGYGSTHSDYLAVRSSGGSLQPSPMVRELMRIFVGQRPGGRG